jgi:hypothetical protein
MSWQPLAEFRTTEETHPDAADAVEAVRAALGRAPVEYLDPAAVSVDADVEYRGAYFRFPHRGDPQVDVCLRHGDGWFHFESPLRTYDGYIDNEDVEGFVIALLNGSLRRLSRLRGGAVVETRLHWVDDAGRRQELGPAWRWRAVWRLALPFGERGECHSISFDRIPAVAAEP